MEVKLQKGLSWGLFTTLWTYQAFVLVIIGDEWTECAAQMRKGSMTGVMRP